VEIGFIWRKGDLKQDPAGGFEENSIEPPAIVGEDIVYRILKAVGRNPFIGGAQDFKAPSGFGAELIDPAWKPVPIGGAIPRKKERRGRTS
jgi:hypothetical protein